MSLPAGNKKPLSGAFFYQDSGNGVCQGSHPSGTLASGPTTALARDYTAILPCRAMLESARE